MFNFGDFVWYNNEAYRYIGMDEDGLICLCRPVNSHPFNIVEFENVGSGEFESFYKQNGRKC